MPRTVLWQIEISHFNEKARWALDYKRLPHVRRAPPPGLNGAVALGLTRGKSKRLPILDIDGRRVPDSTAIIAALEAYKPDPPLYPSDPAARERALALEDFFDEELATTVRRFVWHHTLQDSDAVVAAAIPHAPEAQKRVMRAIHPVIDKVMRSDYDIDEESARAARGAALGAIERLEREIGPSGYLVGDRFTVADLTGAALLTPLLAPPGRPHLPASWPAPVLELREEVRARRAGEWVYEMYARHRFAQAA